MTELTPYTSPREYFAPNGYGLHDMAGNVYEWCWDRYGTYAGGTDPRGRESGIYHVWRGGSWYNNANVARCAHRFNITPEMASNAVGFRCVGGL